MKKNNNEMNALIAELRSYCRLRKMEKECLLKIAEAEQRSYGIRSCLEVSGSSSPKGSDRVFWLMKKEELEKKRKNLCRRLHHLEQRIAVIRSSADGPLLYRIYVENENLSAVAREYGLLPASLYRRLQRELNLLFFR